MFEAKSESKDADLEGLKMPGKATSDTMVSLEDFLSLKKPTGSPSEDESTSNSSLIEELEEASDHSGSSEESL